MHLNFWLKETLKTAWTKRELSARYLNAGVGYDWPRHSIARSLAAEIVNSCKRPPEILGATLPTGSAKHIELAMWNTFYIYSYYILLFIPIVENCPTNRIIGTGNAWAWQSRAKLVEISLTNVKLFDSPEKLGTRAPIGSIENIQFIKMKYEWAENWLKGFGSTLSRALDMLEPDTAMQNSGQNAAQMYNFSYRKRR